MTRIILFRHGEVDNPRNLIYGRSIPVQLNEKGVEQMKNLGQLLQSKAISPQKVYSSPLQRAVDSAKAILLAFGNTPEIKLENDLQDVDHDGIANKNLDWLAKYGVDLYNIPELEGKIEDQEEMAARIIKVLRKVVRENPGETIFVSTHGDPATYAFWRLRFPTSPFLSRKEMVSKEGLKKGEAWNLIFDQEFRLTEYESLAPKD